MAARGKREPTEADVGPRLGLKGIVDVVQVSVHGRDALLSLQFMQRELVVRADPLAEIVEEFDDGKGLVGRPVVGDQA